MDARVSEQADWHMITHKYPNCMNMYGTCMYVVSTDGVPVL